MAQVKVVVNGRSFRMGCCDGEEGRVCDLAAEIESQIQRLKNGSKIVQDDRMFLMAAIMMADQLWDAREEISRLQRLATDMRSYQNGAQGMQRDLNRAMEAGSRSA